jgi:hypothetical protein
MLLGGRTGGAVGSGCPDHAKRRAGQGLAETAIEAIESRPEMERPIEIVGSGETIAFVRRWLAGKRAIGCARWCPAKAFAVAHRGTASLGYRFAEYGRRPLAADRLAALGVPEGPARRELARGHAVVLADGRHIGPEMVQGPDVPGSSLVVVGDAEEVASLVESARGADALAIEATFLERDAALAAAVARDAGVGELLLTHISGRYRPEEIAAEAARFFPATRVIGDFDRITVGGGRRRSRPQRGRAAVADTAEG